MPRPFGELAYTLTDLVIAAYNPTTDTFGTPETVDDGQMFVAEPEADTDKLRGYGQYTAGLAVPIGSKITFKSGGLDFSALAIIAKALVSESGASGNRVRTTKLPAGGAGLGYFGAIGVAATDDGGVLVVGHYKVKLDTTPKVELNGETNKFIVWETAGYSFPVGGFLEVMKNYEAAGDWVKPATGVAFKNFFA
jgi:hypothetical protein